MGAILNQPSRCPLLDKFVAGEPRLRAFHQVFIPSGCRNSRDHLNSIVRFPSSHEGLNIVRFVSMLAEENTTRGKNK
jgi:hypothetical protein